MGSLERVGASRPFFGADSEVVGCGRMDSKVTLRMPGFADRAGVMAAARQHERDVGVAEIVDLINGAPGRDMIALREQMKAAQSSDMDRHDLDDIGYHYAVSCPVELIEARDIRFTGSHVMGDNTGKLGIVLLENLAESGEAWQQEYSLKSLWQKFKGSLDIA